MDNKLFEIKTVIYFKDATTTITKTYTPTENVDDDIFINEGCYVINKYDKELTLLGTVAYPIVGNVKEIDVSFKEIKNEN